MQTQMLWPSATDSNVWFLRFRYHPDSNAALKRISLRAHFDRVNKRWVVPTETEEQRISLVRFAQARHVPLHDAIVQRYLAFTPQSNQEPPQPLLEVPLPDPISHVPGLHNLAALRPYQRRAIARMVQLKRALVVSPTGSGKSVQSLSTVACHKKWPVVVVCRALLRYKWEDEVYKWFPQLRACVIQGRSRRRLPPADVYIVNYEILFDRLGDLLEAGPQALIVDESHYIKEAPPSAKLMKQWLIALADWEAEGGVGKKPKKPSGSTRTWAVQRLADAVSEDGVILCLSATPSPNRHRELWTQLSILHLGERFGGWRGFHTRFCDAKQTPFGWDTSASINHTILHNMLVNTCLVYASSPEAHDLNIEVVTLPFDPHYHNEYAQAKRDIVAYSAARAAQIAAELGVDPHDMAVAAAMRAARAQSIVQLSNLRRIGELAKIRSTVEFVQDQLANTDSKIVVFAFHVEAQQQLVQQLGAVWLKAGMSSEAVTDLVQRFNQDPDTRVLVATFGAKEGHDLQVANQIVVTETPWSFSDLQQMIGRVYGREIDSHGADIWLICAKGSVDAYIINNYLLPKKAIDDVVIKGAQRVVDITPSRQAGMEPGDLFWALANHVDVFGDEVRQEALVSSQAAAND